jgi:hypothetical protein
MLPLSRLAYATRPAGGRRAISPGPVVSSLAPLRRSVHGAKADFRYRESGQDQTGATGARQRARPQPTEEPSGKGRTARFGQAISRRIPLSGHPGDAHNRAAIPPHWSFHLPIPSGLEEL